MFVQVFHGHTNDAAGLKRMFDRWHSELASTASGWQGTTAGVTDDGEFIGVVRFESREAAQGNSDRPEQGSWWQETEKYFDGDVTFHDYDDAQLLLGGGSDDAGFVQVIHGKTSKAARLREMENEFQRSLPEMRPDVIGGTMAIKENGGFTQTIYFRSESEAREGERKTQERADEDRKTFEEYQALVQDVQYFDLKDPWLTSA